MEEDQVVEQQDYLERMIGHMRAEALKRGKDWQRGNHSACKLYRQGRCYRASLAPTTETWKAAEIRGEASTKTNQEDEGRDPEHRGRDSSDTRGQQTKSACRE
ncbi:hypothetical protein NDU88_008458 [Pleurodeles waltl]|uniref:Uncharacterized protein n=1 Tax=Pleurodeles waltl TaxID=8319 RepID=A0AAV7NXV8_PLEWA|nr:hypothetical protein NDU88_008400 [Pleurodeles waltl]KAJ1120247.1 hypothetical protein NDU88_008421 [Pleurodeles waltl]KAJ1120266.1 hypothetical protein NDU88_008440 [Pleurodeles waltl]KAJ1120284.1 hypothetical protein NDU88_008458 [Pleurodeles waltl]